MVNSDKGWPDYDYNSFANASYVRILSRDFEHFIKNSYISTAREWSSDVTTERHEVISSENFKEIFKSLQATA